jgi:spore coat polysaccharide biosynthesis protein SpsF
MTGSVGVIVAARSDSSRLPGKAMLPLNDVGMVSFLLRRLRPLRRGHLVFATTALPSDDDLAASAAREGVPVYRGDSADVVARYVGAAAQFGFDKVARVTGDCPFVDAELVDFCIAQAAACEPFDLATTKGRFPVGLDVEIYKSARMAELHRSGRLSAAHREHLTLFFYDHHNEFTVRSLEPRSDWQPNGRQFTIDTRDDYATARSLVAGFGRGDFSIGELLATAR